MSAARASFSKKRKIRKLLHHFICRNVVVWQILQHPHLGRMSQAKRSFLQQSMLITSSLVRMSVVKPLFSAVSFFGPFSKLVPMPKLYNSCVADWAGPETCGTEQSGKQVAPRSQGRRNNQAPSWGATQPGPNALRSGPSPAKDRLGQAWVRVGNLHSLEPQRQRCSCSRPLNPQMILGLFC